MPDAMGGLGKGYNTGRFAESDKQKEPTMDLREKKTKQSIRNAFLQLRAHKPLERITVKELAELAQISKATFYLHYHDVYDLSEQMQKEVIAQLLNSLDHPDSVLTDRVQFTRELFGAFIAHRHLTDILFSGSQAAVLPISIEHAVKAHVYALDPGVQDNARFNILLTYQVQGAYYAYTEHLHRFGPDEVLAALEEITRRIWGKNG